MSAFQRFLCRTLALSLSVLAATAQAESVDDRWSCPYDRDGGCTANTRSYGYYPTRWRKWPEAPRVADAEIIDTPTTAKPRGSTPQPPKKSESDIEPRQSPTAREKVPSDQTDEPQTPLFPPDQSEGDERESPPDLNSDLPQPPLERDLHKLLPDEPSPTKPIEPKKPRSRDIPAEDDPFRDDPLPEDMPTSKARWKPSMERSVTLKSVLRDPRPEDRTTDKVQKKSAIKIARAAAPAQAAASQRSIANQRSVARYPARRDPQPQRTTSQAEQPPAIATPTEATPIEATKIRWRRNPLAGRTTSDQPEPRTFRTAELTSDNREFVQPVAHQVNPLREPQARPIADTMTASTPSTGDGVVRAARWSQDQSTPGDVVWRGNPLRSAP